MATCPSPTPSSPPSTTSSARPVRRFVETEVAPHGRRVGARTGYFPDWVFRRCGELGFLGLHYPEEFGGSRRRPRGRIVFVEELSRCGALAIAMAISVQTDMATPALAEFGTDDQTRALAPARDRRREDRRDRDHRARRRLRRGRDHHPRPSATATPGGSTAARCSSPTARGPTSSRSSRRPTPTPATAASRCSSSTPTSRASRCRARSRSSGMRSSDTAEIALDDVLVPHADLIGLEPGPGLRPADVAAAVRAARVGRGRGWARREGARGHDRVRARAQDVREADRRAPGDRAQARRRRDRARGGARAALRRRVARHARRVPRRRDLDGEEVLRAGANRLVDACLQVFGGAGYLEEVPGRPRRSATRASNASAAAPTRS